MLDALITSKTRIKLLLKFFLNANNSAYLRNLEAEFGESSNGIRVELNKMEDAGLLESSTKGNKKLFHANRKHPMFGDIQNILMKYTGLDQIVDHVVQKLGNVVDVYLIGDLSRGLESPIIDLVFVGDINKDYLLRYIERAEQLTHKKIRYILYSEKEFQASGSSILNQHHFLLWTQKG
jgi:hypothetical protein